MINIVIFNYLLKYKNDIKMIIIIIIYNKMNDISITNNKILNSLVNKIKNVRKSFNKSKKKISSDTLYNNNLNRTVSELSVDLNTNNSYTSSTKTYSKTNSSNYSKRDKSLDLIRVGDDDYDYDSNNILSKNIDYNHEIVLPYQRYAYNKSRK
tara:strand:+ start:475 stop:933 length:459 start_codon:yes stop_codon:yes gene_type:complete